MWFLKKTKKFLCVDKTKIASNLQEGFFDKIKNDFEELMLENNLFLTEKEIKTNHSIKRVKLIPVIITNDKILITKINDNNNQIGIINEIEEIPMNKINDLVDHETSLNIFDYNNNLFLKNIKTKNDKPRIINVGYLNLDSNSHFSKSLGVIYLIKFDNETDIDLTSLKGNYEFNEFNSINLNKLNSQSKILHTSFACRNFFRQL